MSLEGDVGGFCSHRVRPSPGSMRWLQFVLNFGTSPLHISLKNAAIMPVEGFKCPQDQLKTVSKQPY
jgi:hypothetical protein